jgi:hypothetical protein
VITFKDIELKDKALFDQYFAARNYESSESTFTDLFIWRNSDQLKYTMIQDYLCIVAKYRHLYPYAFSPLCMGEGTYDKVLPVLADCFHSEGFPLVLKAVTEDRKREMEEALPGKLIFCEDRSNYDYVYSTKELIELKGKKFRQKRNHINKFKKSYEYQYEALNDTNLSECLDTELVWISGKEGDESILEEKRAVYDILTNYRALKVTGGVLRINGSVQAFTLGELLNPNMAVTHIEKANTDYDGSFPIMNQLFTAKAWFHIPYINREEDMGIQGMRKAKESYHPVRMIKKYTGFYI